MKPIYLDHHSTTPVDPSVLEAMLPYLRERFGNPSSAHAPGLEARRAVEAARERVAALVGARPNEVVFTSGATEANNLALKGAAAAARRPGRLITLRSEHKSVLDVCRRLEAAGWEAVYLRPERSGQVDPRTVREQVRRSRVTIVSVMWANNEIGSILPVGRICGALRGTGALVHSDAVQAAGRVPVDFRAAGLDYLSLSAHKMYGPKGVGALVVRKQGSRAPLLPLFDGGAQEGGLRSGTVNVAGIVGFGEACRVAARRMRQDARREAALRDRLAGRILAGVDGVRVNGSLDCRLPNNLNLSFEGIRSADLLRALPGIALSSGSACLSTSPEPSHVLESIGVPENLRAGSLRIGIGRGNTAAQIDRAADLIAGAVRRLRRSAGYCPGTGRGIQ